jgi:hypothetical protein
MLYQVLFYLVVLAGCAVLIHWDARRRRRWSYTIKGPPVTAEVLWDIAHELSHRALMIHQGELEVVEPSGLILDRDTLTIHLYTQRKDPAHEPR